MSHTRKLIPTEMIIGELHLTDKKTIKLKQMKSLIKTTLCLISLMGLFLIQSCEVEAEVYSEITPDQFFQNDLQIASAASAAYTPLYGYWGLHQLSDLPTDQSTVPIRSNNGWDDGGLWPRLMEHDFNALDFVGGPWGMASGGVSACNRLIEIFTESLGEDAPVVYELRTLRAFYFYLLLSYYGNIPIETSFAEADPAPSQVPPQEAFAFIESELLASVDLLTEDKNSTYAKINKWVGYSILAQLYLNAERITGTPHWQEAADAAEVVINGGAYDLEAGYFANFKAENEGSNENIFVVPYERNVAGGFGLRHEALHQSAGGTFDFSPTPWGGYSIQEDFYNSFEEGDKRRGMFIVGQQYTVAAGPTYSDELGFYYSSPSEDLKLINCIEDWDNYSTSPELQAQIATECNVFITPDYQLLGGRYLYKNGARYGKYEFPIGEAFDISTDFPIYRYAAILLMRAEALWRVNNNDTEALMLVNLIRERAGVDPLAALAEDDLYWEIKKELAMENHAREIIIRFGHWEDDWFLRTGNKEEFRRIYPIPQSQLQSNPNLQQNPGY